MINATLQRFLHDKVTFGKIVFEGFEHKDIYTIELPWNDNASDASCIPQGIYNVRKHNSPEHPDVWELLNVPNRNNILIHQGNYASIVGQHYPDTEGCILIGLGIKEDVPMIEKSDKCVKYLRRFLKDENFILTVKD